MEMKTLNRWNVAGGIRYFDQLFELNHELMEFYGVDHNFFYSVFDSHPGLLWNGGRPLKPAPWSLEASMQMIKKWNDMGVGFNLTFTNVLLEKKHLMDTDCNMFLEECHDSMNSIVVSSEILRAYIRENYPKYQIKCSISLNRQDKAFYIKAEQLYDRVVIAPDLNKDLELLSSLESEKIEILVNEPCLKNCSYKEEHFRKISQYNLDCPRYFKGENPLLCIYPNHSKDLYLEYDDIKRLNKLGIRMFKIQGRQGSWEFLRSAIKEYIEKDWVRRER